ncbi:GNAT family N-acetyltransferase [Neptuniibacter sp. CAU 1671]|uniref:GNAT family N-acetyltransferase n=1 Tax=Neptuniibacter sp. CAU 1671 TaxID=3032593 RepID=UPI0023DABA75|nr:GNAT family N-acetyltransferase [Neptuniibacter sp. CAU 1671]MDF2181148.1 GNAT family N-acetyltransferase [Neptuniibacter sp. CAU 1671]
MFPGREPALSALKKLICFPKGHFGSDFITLLCVDSKVVGVELGYSHEQLQAQTLVGTLNMFRVTPVSKWIHLTGDVRKALDGYVPLPSQDAYYINNIAVDYNLRGQGLGKRLLQHTIDKARRHGFSRIELDVTESNTAAISFYKKHGFDHTSTSGTADLATNYGLPRLFRMRLVLDTHQSMSTNNHGIEDNSRLINDVTRLNPVLVDQVYVPGNIKQLQDILRRTEGPVSIGGGRFSMGGQVAHEGSLHIDMRGMDRIIKLDVENRSIVVEAGTRWRTIQSVITNHGLAISVMQTYSDFTVGGSVSVNCHGRYIGLGPIILTVLFVKIVTHEGELIFASPNENPEIFYGVVGGYGALGVIVEVGLSLSENARIEQFSKKMKTVEYLDYFRCDIRENSDCIFHNADLAPPDFTSLRAITWQLTDKPVNRERVRGGRKFYIAEMYMLWAITETPLGHLRRKYIYEPLMYLRKKVTYRNDEANYDVTELEPLSRHNKTYVLQEYFVPPETLTRFISMMAEILNRYAVQVVNVSIRHAFKDPGSLLAWAPDEVFALVLYYKQETTPASCERVAVWTRELIDSVISLGGRYYLPYQPHARYDQFHRCYPSATKLFSLKKKLDPNYRFRNCLWEKYYLKKGDEKLLSELDTAASEFKSVYNDLRTRDAFYLFLQNIYHLYPEHEFHHLIIQACKNFASDAEIYNEVRERLPGIKPLLSELTYALPALKKQKQEMTAQTLSLLDANQRITGYLEIGSTGRYVNSLKKALRINSPIYLCNDSQPDMSPPEIMERGGLRQVGTFFPLADYQPISEAVIPTESLDLVTCYIGLHHCPREKLSAFINSINRVLRPGGSFILRDHDADSESMRVFCSLVHTVFNAGIDVPWEENKQELRLFDSVNFWSGEISERGFTDTGQRVLQDNDPSRNTLMRFIKT